MRVFFAGAARLAAALFAARFFVRAVFNDNSRSRLVAASCQIRSTWLMRVGCPAGRLTSRASCRMSTEAGLRKACSCKAASWPRKAAEWRSEASSHNGLSLYLAHYTLPGCFACTGSGDTGKRAWALQD